MNKNFEERNLEVADMDTQATNMPETRSVRPTDRAQQLTHTQAGLQDDQRRHWLLQETQYAVGAAQGPQSVQAEDAARRGDELPQPVQD